MLETILIFVAALLVALLFRPRRQPYVRRVTPSYNGRPYGTEREPT